MPVRSQQKTEVTRVLGKLGEFDTGRSGESIPKSRRHSGTLALHIKEKASAVPLSWKEVGRPHGPAEREVGE